jgi:hypothetical protein
MIQLTLKEVENTVSQFAIPSKQVLGGALPYAFMEHGVLMLSNVLKNESALKMSIRIIEIFTPCWCPHQQVTFGTDLLNRY